MNLQQDRALESRISSSPELLLAAS